jgi:acetolactate synthase-1/2/3 large subunit
VARGFGWGAQRVSDPAELDSAIAQCFAYDGPFFLDVSVAAQANCFPMIPSGRGHHEMMLDEATIYSAPAPACVTDSTTSRTTDKSNTRAV